MKDTKNLYLSSRSYTLCMICCLFLSCNAQEFYFGSDLSYVNEMEYCGVEYFEDGEKKDPYQIFSEHGNNLVRIRKWHTPSWYDQLNDGSRFSDFDDVIKSILRAKSYDQKVLLDFHLSDNWADPSKQLVPSAWLSVVNNTNILKDSLYNYIYTTLQRLDAENALPEMVQIGNETNKGILLSPSDNENWVLDWERNSILFNAAINAARDYEDLSGKSIEVVLHMAGPENTEWLLDGFTSSGVTDFDIIGISYYWAWHQPTTIEETGSLISDLRTLYPTKQVMIVETGYIWTNDWNDNASNIINDTHEDYHPASPDSQKQWMIDLAQAIMENGGMGLIYWEPAWLSSDCWTQWGQGSHQEHACFFNFDNELILPGGIEWMSYNYNTSVTKKDNKPKFQILSNSFNGEIKLKKLETSEPINLHIYTIGGSLIHAQVVETKQYSYTLDTTGHFIVKANIGNSDQLQVRQIIIQ